MTKGTPNGKSSFTEAHLQQRVSLATCVSRMMGMVRRGSAVVPTIGRGETRGTVIADFYSHASHRKA